jgi:hypothetical protein
MVTAVLVALTGLAVMDSVAPAKAPVPAGHGAVDDRVAGYLQRAVEQAAVGGQGDLGGDLPVAGLTVKLSTS